MKRFLISCLFPFLAFGCSTFPIDETNHWDNANRYALPMKVDCNEIQEASGIIGCSFFKSPSGKITFPALWEGEINLESSKCSDYSVTAKPSENIIIDIDKLYDNTKKESCSFKIIRTFSVNNKRGDATVLGKFFIKNMESSYTGYETNLKFKIGDKTFVGFGSLQKKYLQDSPEVVVLPETMNGTFLMYLGDEEVIRYTVYNSNQFTFRLPEGESGDFELSFINKDSWKIELGTLTYEEHSENTTDLSIPTISFNNILKRIYFEFPAKNSKGKKVVYGVKVNSRMCSKTNRCWDVTGKEVYDVTGITMSGRIFRGSYNNKTKSWEAQ